MRCEAEVVDMQSEKVIMAAGGDLRMCCAAKQMAKQTGWRVQAAGFSKASSVAADITLCGDDLSGAVPFDVLVLPIGACADGETVETPFGGNPLKLSALTALMKPGGLVTGGQMKPMLLEKLESLGFETADYLKREELCISNAVPTAEGAIQIAMEETLCTLHGGKAVIVGYGRIGMALAPRLRALGMDTSVCARRWEARALAESDGCHGLPMERLSQATAECDVLFNTVPSPVLVEYVLKALPPEAVVIDLASRPGGTDFEAAKRLGTHVVWALSLPLMVWC